MEITCPPLLAGTDADRAYALASVLDLVDRLGGAGPPVRVHVVDPRDAGPVRSLVPPGVAVAGRPDPGAVAVDGSRPLADPAGDDGPSAADPRGRAALRALLEAAGEPSPAPRTRSLLADG